MNNLKILKDELVRNNIFTDSYNNITTEIVSSIDTNLTEKMKYQIVCHYLTHLVSQLRIPVVFNNQRIPINSISFLFSYSGSGKDTTINKIKNLIEPAMSLIETRRKDINEEQARELAGDNPKDIAKYLNKLPPLEVGISTAEGLVASISECQKLPLGSININSNEFITELSSSNANVLNMLSTLAEMYDVGNKGSKQLKDKTNQIDALSGVFINALFTSSFNIMSDMSVRNKLLSEFKSRFARRSSITFNNTPAEEVKIKDIAKWLADKKAITQSSFTNLTRYSVYFTQVIEHYLATGLSQLQIEETALNMLLIYQQYCKELGLSEDSIERHFSNINITNRFFQALKLSGTFALINSKDSISKQEVVEAINTIELINSDVFVFESEITKDPYEIIIEFCNTQSEVSLPIHMLKKANLITSNSIQTEINNILSLCNSKDKNGLYEFDNKANAITYSRFEQADTYGVSFYKCKSNTKEEMLEELKKLDKLNYAQVNFERLSKLLQSNAIYNNFEFKDGIRKKENLLPYTNWLIFDIDSTDVDIHTAHEMLKHSVNHIIATTSDSSNLFKYRIIFELDTKVKIPDLQYKKVLEFILRDYLGIVKADLLPQSQIFYAYENSIVLSTFDAEKINIKDYLIEVAKIKTNPPLTTKAKNEMLNNSYSTFDYAFQASHGKRHTSLIRVINHAYDLGGDYNYINKLINDINQYWDESIDDLDKTILPHLKKKFGVNTYDFTTDD